MAKKNNNSVEENLRVLYQLQLIDDKIKVIEEIRGALPEEIETLHKKKIKLREELDAIEESKKNIILEMDQCKDTILTAEELIKKYQKQQKNVRNNREYDSFNKEIEYQELEIQLSEKNIKKSLSQLEIFKEDELKKQAEYDISSDLYNNKKDELESIMNTTYEDEQFLAETFEKYSKKIDPLLHKKYEKIKSRSVMGLAVSPLIDGASMGSCFLVPPQVQIEVQKREKIIIDEYSGVILVDHLLSNEEDNKMKKLFSRKIKN